MQLPEIGLEVLIGQRTSYSLSSYSGWNFSAKRKEEKNSLCKLFEIGWSQNRDLETGIQGPIHYLGLVILRQRKWFCWESHIDSTADGIRVTWEAPLEGCHILYMASSYAYLWYLGGMPRGRCSSALYLL
jgi:hypothetical protein